MNLKTSIVGDSLVVMQKEPKTNVLICGSSKYLELPPLILKGPEDFNLIKSKDPSQEILYVHDKKWTIEEAKMYLNALLESAELLKNTTILEIARYRIERENDYSKYQQCEGYRRRNLVGSSTFDNTKCKSLVELSDKCAYCPIGFRCPVCNCIDKDNICYMHQAECIAALIMGPHKSNNLAWIFQVLIPDSWVKLFGDAIYKEVREIRDRIFNVFYTSDLVCNIKVTVLQKECSYVDFVELMYLLRYSPLWYRFNVHDIEFHVDANTLDVIKGKIPELVYHEEIFNIPQEPYDKLFSIRGITFGDINSGADIIDDGLHECLGDPRNLYTYSILYCMKDYISSTTGKVLDIGCGRGTTSLYAKKCGANTIDAIDKDYNACINTRLMFEQSSEGLYLYTKTRVINKDIFEFINFRKSNYFINLNKNCYDVIIGNLCYDVQKDLLPEISSLLNPGGVYIISGIPILIENALLNIQHDLELIDSRYFYNSAILVFQKRKEIRDDNLQ